MKNISGEEKKCLSFLSGVLFNQAILQCIADKGFSSVCEYHKSLLYCNMHRVEFTALSRRTNATLSNILYVLEVYELSQSSFFGCYANEAEELTTDVHSYISRILGNTDYKIVHNFERSVYEQTAQRIMTSAGVRTTTANPLPSTVDDIIDLI